MSKKSFQDYYPDNTAVCYGCGRLNEHGLHVRSFWEGDVAVAHFTPRPYHTAIPGYTYGGLLASLIDCHATGTAAAAMYREENRAMDSDPPFRFVTGSLNVRFVAPTPIDAEIRLEARVKTIKGKMVEILVDVFSGGERTAGGLVVTFQMPETLLES